MPRVHVHLPYKKLLENINYVRERKLDLEIYFDSSSLDTLDEKDFQRLKGALNWNPHLSFHGPFMDMSPGGVDEKVRKVTLERLLHLVEIAKVFKPKVLIFHPGYDRWRFHGHEDRWLENSLKTWSQVLESARETTASIAIENVFEEDPSTLEDLIKEIDSDRFGICLDTGHFHLFSKSPLTEWIDRLGHRLIEVHIHDNNGTKDEHLTIGDGTIDFDFFFRLLKGFPNMPLLTIEVRSKEAVEKSIEKIMTFL